MLTDDDASNRLTSPKMYLEARNQCLTLGAQSVRKQVLVPKSLSSAGRISALPEHATEQTQADQNLMTPRAALLAHTAEFEAEYPGLTALAQRVVQEVDAGPSRGHTDEPFFGYIKRVTMTNFLGVQGTTAVDLGAMPGGLWLIQGENGAGKSTLLEAISWLLKKKKKKKKAARGG